MIAACLVALLLAWPASGRAAPEPFETAWEAVRQKARAAYLSGEPIDAAVADADRRRLGSSSGASPDDFRKSVELLEAVKAVKTIQGASGVLVAGEEARLRLLIHERLGISGAQAASPNGSSPGPTAEFLRRLEAGEAGSRKKAQAVMGGAGALRDLRGPADGAFPGAGALARRTPVEDLRASEFRPQYKTGAVMTMPSPPVKSFEPPTWFERFSAATQTTVPVPGAEWASRKFNEFSAERMRESAKRDLEGAALLEQGGAVNTVKAGWKAVESFAGRIAAGDPAAIKAVAVGAGAAAGVAMLVLAAPAVGVVGAALGVAQAGLVGYSTYGMVNAVPAFAKKPDYLNAGTIILNAAGAGYAGPLVKKTGELAAKGITSAATLTPKSAAGAAALSAIPVLSRAGNVAAKGSTVAVKAGHEAGLDAVTESIADTARVVQYKGGPYAAWASMSAVTPPPAR